MTAYEVDVCFTRTETRKVYALTAEEAIESAAAYGKVVRTTMHPVKISPAREAEQ